MKIKKLEEYTNYSDNVTKKLPKELVDSISDSPTPTEILSKLSPRIRRAVEEVIRVFSFEDNITDVDDILIGFDDSELLTIQAAFREITNFANNLIINTIRQN